MLKKIDAFLNTITLYRLVMYYLFILLGIAVVFAYAGILPFSGTDLIFSASVLLLVSWLANSVFAWAFDAHANTESFYITAIILSLIITPAHFTDSTGIWFLIWVAILAVASKFILAIGRKHIFNPAAIAVVITVFTIGGSASWWIGGNIPMMPFVVIGGFLVVRKVQRFRMAGAFLGAAWIAIALTSLEQNPFIAIEKSILHTPILFFASIMLTEPLTTPPTFLQRFSYGALIGFLFAPAVHIGSIYSTPELALVVGNIFSYIVSPKLKPVLTLTDIIPIGTDLYDFIFHADRPMRFQPGQYLKWTLAHTGTDTRGNRRYFTIASSPTEPTVRVGIKYHPTSPSSFKRALRGLAPGDQIVAGQLAGDFTLPRDEHRKLVFIAGGIGVTPYRSMVKYILDNNQKRAMTLLYSARTPSDIVYRDVFDEAVERLNMKAIYTITDDIPAWWDGHVGLINEEMVVREVPDYRTCIFYLSGPHGMVTHFQSILRHLGIPRSHVKVDFFPGFT